MKITILNELIHNVGPPSLTEVGDGKSKNLKEQIPNTFLYLYFKYLTEF